MADAGVHKDDIGTQFKLTVKRDDVAIDMSAWTFDGATGLQIRFEKPDGTTLQKDAVFDTDGSDGVIVATSVAGDIDLTGRWKMQGYLKVTDPAAEVGAWHTQAVEFTVYEIVGG